MKTGEEFWGSKEEQALNRAFVLTSAPLYWLARRAVRNYIPDELQVVLEQYRVDVGDLDNPPLFPIRKFTTLRDDTPKKIPLNQTARKLRAKGWDELPQRENIRRGEMNAFGPRAVAPQDHKRRVIQRWRQVEAGLILPEEATYTDYVWERRKRGVFSGWSIAEKFNPKLTLAEQAVMISELDNQDARCASVSYNIRQFAGFLGQLVELAWSERNIGHASVVPMPEQPPAQQRDA